MAIEKVQVNVRIAKPLMDALNKIALPFGWSNTEAIRRAIEEYVERHQSRQLPDTQPRRQQ